MVSAFTRDVPGPPIVARCRHGAGAQLQLGNVLLWIVWVFDTEQALNKFVDSGWEIGAQATASAKAGDKGASYQGAVAVSPGVWLYQVTGDSLAVELTAKGTKYYKDSDLN